MIKPAVIALVKSKSAITDEIGTNPTRIYPRVVPQGLATYPAVTFRDVSTRNTVDFDDTENDLDFANIDFHFYADTALEAEQLAKLFRNELNASSGTFGGENITDVRFVPSGFDDYSDTLEKYIYQIELQFTISR